MKKLIGAMMLVAFFSACENPQSPASQFLFKFETAIKSGSQEEFASKLFDDPRTDDMRVTPNLLSAKDGSKAKLVDSKEFLKTYLSSRKIDYTKTATTTSGNSNQQLTDANGVTKEYLLKVYSLNDNATKKVIMVDLWTRVEDNKFAIGDVVVFEKLP